MRVHNRKDFQYEIRKAVMPISGRAAYAVIISQSTAYPGVRCVYHVEIFYATMTLGRMQTGTQLRAEARRYGSALCKGNRGVHGYRNQYLPVQFGKLDIPTEDKVEIR